MNPNGSIVSEPSQPRAADAPDWLARFEADRRAAFEQLHRGDLAGYGGAYVAFYEGHPVVADRRCDLAQQKAVRR